MRGDLGLHFFDPGPIRHQDVVQSEELPILGILLHETALGDGAEILVDILDVAVAA